MSPLPLADLPPPLRVSPLNHIIYIELFHPSDLSHFAQRVTRSQEMTPSCPILPYLCITNFRQKYKEFPGFEGLMKKILIIIKKKHFK